MIPLVVPDFFNLCFLLFSWFGLFSKPLLKVCLFYRSFKELLYQFPIATVIEYCKYSSLKQHNFITLELWKSEIKNRPGWADVKVLSGPTPSGGSEGNIHFVAFFQLLEAACILTGPWPLPVSFSFLFLLSHLWLWTSCPL